MENGGAETWQNPSRINPDTSSSSDGTTSRAQTPKLRRHKTGMIAQNVQNNNR